MPKRTNKNDLTPEQQKFADEWLIDNNGTRAYKVAYDTEMTDHVAGSAASRLLDDVKVRSYIEQEQAKIAAKYKITRERVLEEEAYIAFSDPRTFFNDDGTIKSPDKMPAHIIRAMSAFEHETKTYGKDDDTTEVTKRKFKLWDKGRALERIEKHLGMFEKDNQQKRPSLEEVFKAIEAISPKLGEALKEYLSNAATS